MGDFGIDCCGQQYCLTFFLHRAEFELLLYLLHLLLIKLALDMELGIYVSKLTILLLPTAHLDNKLVYRSVMAWRL